MKLTAKQDIETGIALALALLLFAWIVQDWIFVFCAGISLGVVLIAPVLLRPLAYVWFGLAQLLGFIVPKILLTILFCGLVIPVGIIRRWMGKDSLHLNDFKNEQDSILKDRKHTYQAEDLKNPF